MQILGKQLVVLSFFLDVLLENKHLKYRGRGERDARLASMTYSGYVSQVCTVVAVV